MKERCFLVYALAPEGTTAREANDRLNDYRGVGLDELAAEEPDDPRFWWKRRSA